MAGRIPQHFIDELMRRVDIVDVIGQRVPLKKAGREFTACCPFHTEKTPSFYVSPEKQFYHCFGCGAHGTALGFLMDYEHMEFPEAVEALASACGLEVPREGDDEPARPKRDDQPLYDILEAAAQSFRHQLREHPAGRRAVEYLKRRGLSGEIARDFAIGYAPPGWNSLLDALGGDPAQVGLLENAGLVIAKENGEGHYDRFRDRVMFPIRDRRGRVIAFGGRVLGEEKPKYLNSPETPVFHKGQELYGLWEAQQANRHLERLLVVEGYMDVVALAQFGIRNAVATLGTSTSREHMERMFRVVPEVVFCFDGDRAGRQAAWRALENTLPAMREGRQARFLFLPEGEDPDTLVRKEGSEAFTARITQEGLALSDFLFQHLAAEVDLASMEGRARLASLARPLLEKLPPGLYRQMMVERLAKTAAVDTPSVEAMLSPRAEQNQPPPPPQRPARRSAPARSSPSLVRRALVLLLHRPSLAAGFAEPPGTVRDLGQPGTGLLAELLSLLQAEPGLTAGGLLERFRERDELRHLARLAAERVETPDEAMEEEFMSAVRRLISQGNEQRVETLLQKSRSDGLSQDEKHELQQLLGQMGR